MSRALAALLLASVILSAAPGVAWPQEGILTLRIAPAALDMPAGGTALARVRIENASAREADDIEITWAGPDGFTLSPPPEIVAALGAFASTTVEIAVSATESAPQGEMQGGLEVIYTYCIDDLCYQIIEPVRVTLRVSPPAEPASNGSYDVESGTGPQARVDTPRPLLALVVVVLLGLSALLLRGARHRTALAVALIVVGGAALGVGVSQNQHKQAQAVGAVLCTSCVGIETVQTLSARLSSAQVAAVERLAAPVELLVFYAPWCRSCPYAEAMVELVSIRNPLVHYRLVNAEVERDLAALYGVTRAGRTIVPAIVHLGTGKVLFGAEDLGDRLVSMLQEVS